MEWHETPTYVLTKDRKSCLSALIERLERDGLNNIFIVDTGSTYPPMLEYLSGLKWPVLKVEPREDHAPKHVLWDREIIKATNQEKKHFLYTDCDVVPDEGCPDDWLRHLYRLLRKHNTWKKAGLGLRLDDIPECYAHRELVIEHESLYWRTGIEDHVFASELDTTMALYLPGTPHLLDAIRTGGKYLARHLPWYYDSANLPDEEKWYLRHLHPKASMWTRKDAQRETMADADGERKDSGSESGQERGAPTPPIGPENANVGNDRPDKPAGVLL